MTVELWNPKYDETGLEIKVKEPYIITPTDFMFARKLYDSEKIDLNNTHNFFRGIVYSFCTSSDNYGNQMKTLRGFLSDKILSPSNFESSISILSKHTRNLRYNVTKNNRLINLVGWWNRKGQYFYEKIYSGLKSKDDELSVRKELANSCPGISFKCASLILRMCNYWNCVPQDIHMFRFLKNKIGIDVPDSLVLSISNVKNKEYKPNKRAPTEKQYLKYEQDSRNVANQYGFLPAALQMVIYRKESNWKTDIPQQTNLFYDNSVTFLKPY